MTDKKISQLTNITGSNVDDANDELAIVDASSNETKAITRAELFKGIDGDVTLSGEITADEATLAEIAASKADTAVDVFVYDTSKDSDGGAWRHRTQHTSWYNETLNTATRGSRREFPAVAVIVAESDKVTIYDGDDPSLPMWMVFNTTGIFSGSDYNSCAALNGILVCGEGSGFGSPFCNFIADFGLSQLNSFTVLARTGSIVDRNLSGTANPNVGYTGVGTIVNNTVNDVAMTVLPDSSLDLATQLPKVDIAVATDGNGTYLASIIKSDGNVYDVGADGGSEAVSVSLDGSELTVVRADGTVFVWDDIGQITSDGVSPDATYSASSTPALIGTASQVAA